MNRDRFTLAYSDNNKIFTSLVALSLLIISLGTLFSAYLQQSYSETISFFVRDGWCKIGEEGLGIHCFSDFYAPMSIASNPNPWTNDLKLAYTPLSFSYFRFLSSGFISSIGTHASLYVNLIFTIFALSTPGLYVWKNQKKFNSISGKWIVLLSLTSAPSLIMLDRGSSSFLLFPLVFFFFLGIQESNFKLSAFTLIMMSLWKPQSLILSMGILLFFGIKPFIRTCAQSILLIGLSFILYPTNIIRNILDWIQNSKDYQNYVPIPTPGNYSFVNFIGFLKGFTVLVVHPSSSIQSAFRPPMDQNFVSIFCAIYAVFILILFAIAKNSISKFQFVLYISIFLLTLAGTTFGYYLTLMLIPIFLLTPNQIKDELKIKGNQFLWSTYLVLLVLMVPAWPVTWRNLPFNVGESWTHLGIQWTGVHIFLAILAIISLVQLSLISFSKLIDTKRI